MDQRCVGLKIMEQTPESLVLQSPPNANIAPPGYYMLFLLNEDGVPSVAKFVQIE